MSGFWGQTLRGEGLPSAVGGAAAAVYGRPAESPLRSVRLLRVRPSRNPPSGQARLAGHFRALGPNTRGTVAMLTPSATPTAHLRKTREFGRLVQAVGSGGVGAAGTGERLKADRRPPGVRTVSHNDRSGWMCNLGVNSSP